MKRTLMYILMAFPLLIACNKKDTTIPKNVKDSIVYKVFDSTFKITSLRSWSQNYSSTCTQDYPIPTDSIAFRYIDVDNDNINDFKVEVSHGPQSGQSCSSHCTPYNYGISISGVNSTDSISGFSADSIISSSICTSIDYIFVLKPCGGYTDFTDKYIGFKHNKMLGWIQIAPTKTYKMNDGQNTILYAGIQIIDYAINTTKDRQIKLGQKK
jgi:hypothetical protein